MTFAILGYGRFGRAFGELLAQAGIPFKAYDPGVEIAPDLKAASVAEAVQSARWIVLAMPVARLESVLQEIRPFLDPQQIVIDVCSVKVGPCALLDRWLGPIPHAGTHPLFGPLSLSRAEHPLRVVICASPLHPSVAVQVRALFQKLGCVCLDEDPESHDRNMAQTHALAFFVAKGLLDVGVGEDPPIAPPSFQGLKHTIEAVRADAGHLFAAIQRENPFAAEARAKLLEALSSIHQRLSEESAVEETIPMATPDLRVRSPELKEVRDLIDEVDREILGLLQQRTELAQRAAKAKAQLGAPVLDPAREKSLMENRRLWARELGLNEEIVEEVFRTLLRVSRRAQAG